MRVTFMIGNGFDLVCGLKTRFVDVYNEYCSLPSKNKNLEYFKKEILGKNNDYENWTDFEMALPNFGEKINDFDKFEECVMDFSDYLNDYLVQQEERIDIETNKVSNLVNKYIYQFYEYTLYQSKNTLKSRITNPNENCVFEFITFNYTQTLEKLLATIQNKQQKSQYYSITHTPPLHIHGKLNNGILLGLDNEELYKNIPCKDIRKLKSFIDKVHRNNRRNNLSNEALEKLQNSNLIVILGWSMGQSDSFWINNIKRILEKNKNINILYFPYYREAISVNHNHKQLNREDDGKDFIGNLFKIDDLNRIHIITDQNYMNLCFISQKNK